MRHLALLTLLAACGDDAIMPRPDAQPDSGSDGVHCPTRMADPDPAFDAFLQTIAPVKGGMGVAVLNGPTLVHEATLGVLEKNACEPFTKDTRVRLGRPARTLVALAALSLAADGTLDLDANVTTYIPGFHTTPSMPVTVRQLLDHSAGIYVAGFMSACPSQDPVQYWGTVAAHLEFAPGTAIGNYDEELSLLGAVVAAAANKPYRDVVTERIFTPLDVHATFDHDAFLLGEHARGDAGDHDPPACAAWEPVHQVYVSLDDLVRLARFLSQGDTAILPATWFDKIRHAGALHHEKEFSTGYGLDSFKYDTAGNLDYTTDGDIERTGAEIDIFDDGYAAILIANTGICTYCTADKIIKQSANHPFKNWLAPLPTSRWGEYVGTFQDAVSIPARTLVVQLAGTQLTADYNGTTLQLTPFGEDTFDIDVFGSLERLRFWRDANGVTQLLTSQFGKTGPAFTRVP